MGFYEKYAPIDIEASKIDSRNLIMPHQSEAVEAMTNYFQLDQDLPNRNGMVVMPTGSGKTYTSVTWLLKECVSKGYRVVWLVHRQELVEQTYCEFKKQAPLLKGSGKKMLKVLPVSGVHIKMSAASGADVYVCSIASVANKYGYRFIERMLGAQGKRKVVVVIDEAHHATASNYQKVVKRITKLNNNRILLGLTATPTRMNKVQQKHLQEMFNIDENIKHGVGKKGYVYEITLKQLLASGFLAEPKYIPVFTEIIGEIEYQCSEADEQYFLQFGDLPDRIKNRIGKSSARNKIIVEQYVKNQELYGKTIVFAYDQNHAETLCEEFKKAGISCDYAVSDRNDAQVVIQKFKDNEFKVLINVQILTEGSDVPDIQTVFLARETNSDSLLMQMIGRGLRGEKANGTKEAYIVAFHDTWDRFVSWLDPKQLDVFDIDEETETEQIESEEVVEIEPNWAMLELLERLADCQDADEVPMDENDMASAIQENDISQRDLYMKLYRLMKLSLVSEEKAMMYPCGWYSLVDEDGDEVKLLVFHEQRRCYESIRENITVLKKHLSVDILISMYFAGCEVIPEYEELQYLIDYIEDEGEMPEFFAFSDRAAFEPKEIISVLKKLGLNEEQEEQWLKELFEKAPILKAIYHYFYAFKKTIYDAMKDYYEGELVYDDDRNEYEVIDNYFNLPELLLEIKQQYPKLSIDDIYKIAWSNNVVRNWWALAERELVEGKYVYQLHINKVLSSPKIDKEVIKYLIFHELLHINGYWDHDEEFRKREWQYPNSDELDGILDSLCLEYNMDVHFENSVANETHFIGEKMNEDLHESIDAEDEQPAFNPNAKGVKVGIKYCRNCGNKLPSDAKFCDKCGSSTEY